MYVYGICHGARAACVGAEASSPSRIESRRGRAPRVESSFASTTSRCFIGHLKMPRGSTWWSAIHARSQPGLRRRKCEHPPSKSPRAAQSSAGASPAAISSQSPCHLQDSRIPARPHARCSQTTCPLFMTAVHRPHACCSQAVRVVARRRVLGYRLERLRRLLDESVIIPVLAARRV